MKEWVINLESRNDKKKYTHNYYDEFDCNVESLNNKVKLHE